MWISSTPSPPLEGTALLEAVPHQGPLSFNHKAVHQPQQRGVLLQETKKLSISPGVLLGLGKLVFTGLLLGCPGGPQWWLRVHGPRLGCPYRLPVSYHQRCSYRLKFPEKKPEKKAEKKPEVESVFPGRGTQPPNKMQQLKKEHLDSNLRVSIIR